MDAKRFMEQLQKDADYQARTAEKQRQWAEQEALLRRDEKPLVEALTAAGWPPSVRQCGNARSVWDLVNTAESYPHLLETLADHLSRPYHACIREGIARALAVREARRTRIPRVVMDELKKQTDPQDAHEAGYRWALINTLVLIGDSSMTEEVRLLLHDPRYAAVRADLQRVAKALNRPGRRFAKAR